MASVLGRVFVYGGKGALGSVCVNTFKSKNWVSVCCPLNKIYFIATCYFVDYVLSEKRESFGHCTGTLVADIDYILLMLNKNHIKTKQKYCDFILFVGYF